MARKVRVTLPNIPLHILKKGINQESVFHDLEDYEAFYLFMVDISQKLEIKIYAYVLLKESFEVVISCSFEDNISKFMQILSQQYVLYYNKKYRRSGTIWEGRYKSSLIEKEIFLEKVISYIEYLSIENNLIDTICTSVKDKKKIDLEKNEIEFIENALNSGLITGSKEYIEEIENRTGVSFFVKKRGRPTNKYIKGDKLYKNLELLSKERHKDLKIGNLENLLFVKSIPSFPIIAQEAEIVAKNFPIVFVDEENPSVVAMTSLGGENLAISSDGKWLSEYIPAMYRKYPFTYASNKENPEQRAVAIDMDAPNLSTQNGTALFDEQSNQTDYLKNIIHFLNSCEQESLKAKAIAKIISDAGILEDRELSIGEGETKQVLAKGFRVVDMDKLYKLDDETLASWVRNGVISFINIHIKSLDNMQSLMNLLYARNN
ncbi:SapC family protein [Aliarcobacter cryaerophilus]|uniref:SapC family protein n=1 Tax=Aliarcobacter cryaerophilus TaxID=28198 RepID=UPI003DA3AE9A